MTIDMFEIADISWNPVNCTFSQSIVGVRVRFGYRDWHRCGLCHAPVVLSSGLSAYSPAPSQEFCPSMTRNGRRVFGVLAGAGMVLAGEYRI